MEQFLAGNCVHEAFECMRGWYKKRTGHTLMCKPLRTDLDQTCETYTALYKARSSHGDPLPINVHPTPIFDDPPDEDEIVRVLHQT